MAKVLQYLHWTEGEIRRCEHAWSPRFQCYGVYMLGGFIKNIEDSATVLKKLLKENEDTEVLLVEYLGKRNALSGDYWNHDFRIAGKYTYADLPPEYKDVRGQYPSDCDQGASWDDDKFMVTGFPLRPWLSFPVPCTEGEFYDIKARRK